jgi:hypothetical protein
MGDFPFRDNRLRLCCVARFSTTEGGATLKGLWHSLHIWFPMHLWRRAAGALRALFPGLIGCPKRLLYRNVVSYIHSGYYCFCEGVLE